MSRWVYCGKLWQHDVDLWVLPSRRQPQQVGLIVEIDSAGDVHISQPTCSVTTKEFAESGFDYDTDIPCGPLGDLVEDLANLLATVRSCGR